MIKKIFVISIALGVMLSAKDSITLPTSFKANFKQIIISDSKKKIKYSGELAFSKPNHFKWSYTSPTKKEVCTDGTELLVVDHDLEQVSAYFIDNNFDLVEILKKANRYDKKRFVAKHKDTNYTIGVNKKSQLSSIVYKDELDNKVVIMFSHIKYSNNKIKISKLKCNYPASYDKIR